MPKGLGYADAVRLLGGSDGRVAAVVEALAGGLLVAAGGGGLQVILGFLDTQDEFGKLNRQLVGALAGRLGGLSRFDRTERLAAARRILVVSAFFDSMREAEMPFSVSRLALGKSAQVAVATGEAVSSRRLGEFVGVLNDSSVAGDFLWPDGQGMPDAMLTYYAHLGGQLVIFLQGLAFWDELDVDARRIFARTVRDVVPAAAVRRYEEYLRQLAAEFPEVAVWADQLGHAATHDLLRQLCTSLAGVGLVLDQVASGGLPDERRQALARSYARTLDRPVIAAGDIPDGLVIPALSNAYLNPRYKAGGAASSARLEQEEWWDGFAAGDDFQDFLICYLTSVRAAESPLLVLGQPGSGKSVLTKVIAARLPARDFLAVRVPLRDVPADADLQSQIEYAVREATGESLTWPALVRSAGTALPVILLDGFDELLQATGVGQTDYLEQIVRFQDREADQGRPAAVIVTSRTAVADRARIPPGGMVAVRLEPFSQEQVRTWLAVWNAGNAGHLARHGLRQLTAEVALRQPDLAVQPLLLLMLALYDADGNALQRHEQELDEANLYERLFGRFAAREIAKTRPELTAGLLAVAVEEELAQLSVTAMAMVNRRRYWVTSDELSADLRALLPSTSGSSAVGFRAPPTPAQTIAGKFFFIHQSQALRDGTRLSTYEFLHATFGEFLAARLIVRELADLAAITATRNRFAPDDSFLAMLLSFAPLTARRKIMDFLAALTKPILQDQRQLLRQLLLAAFRRAHEPFTDNRNHGSYRPGNADMPERHAAYSANLLTVLVLISGKVTGRELFPDAIFPAYEWRRHTLLWRSQLTPEEWESLVATLRLERTWHSGNRDITVSAGPWEAPEPDMFWTFKIPPGDERRERLGWRSISARSLRLESYFTCDMAEDIAWHALAPISREMDTNDIEDDQDVEATSAIGTLSEDQAVSATHAMIVLWLTSSSPAQAGDLEQAYENCLTVITGSRPDEYATSRNSYLSRVLRQVAADRDRLSSQFRAATLDLLKPAILQDAYLHDHPAVLRWATEAFTDLGYKPLTSEQEAK